MSAHTPGRWEFRTDVRSPKGYGFVYAGSIDARVKRDPPSGCAVVVATVTHDDDGALIAAAPELLAALKRVYGHVCAAGDEQAIAQIDAALAKAEGR